MRVRVGTKELCAQREAQADGDAILGESLRREADEVLTELEIGETYVTCCIFPDIEEPRITLLHDYLFAQAHQVGLRLELAPKPKDPIRALPFNRKWRALPLEGAAPDGEQVSRQ